jgi:hypothetical protein
LIYLYCITGSRQLPLLPAASVFPVFPPYTICAAGLAAIVSRVPDEEYDPERTPQRVVDRLWVEQRSPAHEAVVSTVLRQTTMVPAAFFTVLENEEQVTAYLEKHVETLEAQLDLLRDRQEFWIDIERAGRRAKTEGAREMLLPLCQYADGFMERRVAAWNPRKRVASWSLLVKRDQRAQFLTVARKLAEECRGRRLVLDCSGPWAPGSFAIAPPAGPQLISRPA